MHADAGDSTTRCARLDQRVHALLWLPKTSSVAAQPLSWQVYSTRASQMTSKIACRLAWATLPGPEGAEAFAMPGDNGVRLHDDQGRSPTAPRP
jgi:hypothetical protein